VLPAFHSGGLVALITVACREAIGLLFKYSISVLLTYAVGIFVLKARFTFRRNYAGRRLWSRFLLFVDRLCEPNIHTAMGVGNALWHASECAWEILGRRWGLHRGVTVFTDHLPPAFRLKGPSYRRTIAIAAGRHKSEQASPASQL
jgi:hypothetical protein